jgi:hypothetical protein
MKQSGRQVHKFLAMRNRPMDYSRQAAANSRHAVVELSADGLEARTRADVLRTAEANVTASVFRQSVPAAGCQKCARSKA